MDCLGVRPKANKNHRQSKKPIKIVYIANPKMFEAKNAADFRALVQELTGNPNPKSAATPPHDLPEISSSSSSSSLLQAPQIADQEVSSLKVLNPMEEEVIDIYDQFLITSESTPFENMILQQFMEGSTGFQGHGFFDELS